MKNKGKCKMVINNKIYSLTDRYQIVDENIKLLKIRLLIINNTKINLEHMFYKCKFLKEFHLIQEDQKSLEDEHKKVDEANQTGSGMTDYFDNYYQLYTTLKSTYNSNNITSLFNQDTIIYNMYNNSYNNKENENLINIINLSHEFLSSSYSSIKSNANNIEFSSFNENSFSFKSWKIKGLNINEYFSEEFEICKKDYIIATDLSCMFYGCISLLSITGLSKINTSNVKYMNNIFEDCSKLKKISDISKFDTQQVENIGKIFAGCSSLKLLPDIFK